jgi:hypothetical protein
MDSYMDQYRTGQLDAMHIADGDEGEKYQARHEARDGVQVNMRDVPSD